MEAKYNGKLEIEIYSRDDGYGYAVVKQAHVPVDGGRYVHNLTFALETMRRNDRPAMTMIRLGKNETDSINFVKDGFSYTAKGADWKCAGPGIEDVLSI